MKIIHDINFKPLNPEFIKQKRRVADQWCKHLKGYYSHEIMTEVDGVVIDATEHRCKMCNQILDIFFIQENYLNQ